MIYLIGTGQMAIDYSSVLKSLDTPFLVVGRGIDSAKTFQDKTSVEPIVGGLENFVSENRFSDDDFAIVATGVEQLAVCCTQLMNAGLKRILVEKPAGLTVRDIDTLVANSSKVACEVFVAYNRRFFASVLELKKRIHLEGGVTSFNFEFTEWAHVIEKLNKSEEALQSWFISNSTHVVDLSFYLGGKPEKLASFISGGLDWHKSGSVFSGAGVSDNGALFSYSANWESAGRWSVEVLTKKNRYVLRPMEQLQVQSKGTVKLIPVEISDQLDKDYKPGLYRQVEAFLSCDRSDLCSIEEQQLMFNVYSKMADYI